MTPAAAPRRTAPAGPGEGRLAVVAVGGHPLAATGAGLDRALDAVGAQIAAAAATGWRVLVVHGSGPQVGLLLRRSELAAAEVPPVAMDLATAQTQGWLGVLLQRAITHHLPAGHPGGSATLVTQAVVDVDDPALGRPTKPIGPVLGDERAHALADRHGWQVRPTDGGWRRVVPSPAPVEVVELPAIRALVATGTVAVAAGGGGVPVARRAHGRLAGVEAVIDKDHTASLLARQLDAETLVIATSVPGVALDLGTARERWLATVTDVELRHQLDAGQFPPGSMGPKVEAVLAFLTAGGGRAAIVDLDRLGGGLTGAVGTRVVRAGADARPTRTS